MDMNRDVRRLALIIICLVAWMVAAEARPLEGEVVEVESGDTLAVMLGQKRLRVLLAEVDAPELRQEFGERATASLADICLNKTASVETLGQDRSGRVIARVKCGEVDASAEQVRRGMAWVAVQKGRKLAAPLYLLQDQAQRGREGLWKSPSPVEPWVWRRMKK